MKDYSNPRAEAYYCGILSGPEDFPFAFRFGETDYKGFDSRFEPVGKREYDEGLRRVTETEYLLGALKVKVKSAFCTQYGAFEWTVYFTNTGSTCTPVLTDVRSEMEFEGGLPVLKGIMGDHVNQYRPYCHDLTSLPVRFVSSTGRATHITFPYFNLQYADRGVMLAIGWAGTWTADFVYDGTKTRYTARSVNNLSVSLKPGETIRTALFAAAPYSCRNDNYAANYWRSYYINANMPKADASGKPLEPFSSCNLSSDTGIPNSDGSISERSFTWKPTLEKMIAEDTKVDFRWFDAGWYIAPDGTSPLSDWWGTVGTWELDREKWPGDSFAESVRWSHEHGIKTLMWFEPERVTDPDSLVKNYGYHPDWAIRMPGSGVISNNIGDEECLKWTVERVTKTLRENRVDMYREDNNCDAAALWTYLDAAEGEGRQGITECRFIANHYRMWDSIIACTVSYGGCAFVDSCAGGGGRNDLESMRRGIPLLRSDSDREGTSLRLSMTTAFNLWIPFCGANTKEKQGQLALTGVSDPYVWRASYLASLNVDSQFVQDPQQDFGILRFGLREWQSIRKYLLKDLYVLTPWHDECDRTGFTAYSYYDEEAGEGILLAFRMEDCRFDTYPLRLPYARDEKTYTLTDADTGESLTPDGRMLRTQGLNPILKRPRTARLWYLKEN